MLTLATEYNYYYYCSGRLGKGVQHVLGAAVSRVYIRK